MVKVCKKQFPKSDGFYLDGYTKENLDKIKKLVRKDWDWCIVIDGIEGSGKSVLAQQIGFYFDPTLDINRITFTKDSFIRAVLKAKPFQTVIFDEAFGSLNSRQAMSMVNRVLLDLFAEIRQKNLFLIVVIPSFFDLDRGIALWRSRNLFHVYVDKTFKRGRYAFFGMGKKTNLYTRGKKFYSYHAPKADYFGSFTGFYVVDKKEYQTKKLAALRAYAKLDEEDAPKAINRKYLERMQARQWKTINYLYEQTKLPFKKIGKIMDWAESTLIEYYYDPKILEIVKCSNSPMRHNIIHNSLSEEMLQTPLLKVNNGKNNGGKKAK